MAICALVLGYALLGSCVFLALEGGPAPRNNGTGTGTPPLDEMRARTVESIWDITVSLNILYRDNWTRLAASEIARFQDQLVREVSAKTQHQRQQNYEWNFARAFLYSLTVLTTIGYGSVSPRTALGKALTMGYAALGIPLMLLYLSSVGSLLSRCVRGACVKRLCCCLCSNCGYCCYDETRMREKERRMRRKRQQMEMQLQEPFYVRSGYANSLQPAQPPDDSDSEGGVGTLGAAAGSLLAPVLTCLLLMLLYVLGGAAVLSRLEAWPFLDAAYFCFMSLSTVGFGDLLPGARHGNATVWFCSAYILTGMALTAMCFNILHDEIVHRLRHVGESEKPSPSEAAS